MQFNQEDGEMQFAFKVVERFIKPKPEGNYSKNLMINFMNKMSNVNFTLWDFGLFRIYSVVYFHFYSWSHYPSKVTAIRYFLTVCRVSTEELLEIYHRKECRIQRFLEYKVVHERNMIVWYVTLFLVFPDGIFNCDVAPQWSTPTSEIFGFFDP